MSLKICYDDEIHKISKLPLSILDLRNKISSVFRDTLPTNYRLEYLDTDGDRIVISNNTAYRELIDQGLPSGGKPLKIYVAYFNPNRKREKGNEKVSGENQQKTGPIHIQNKEEFAEDLPKPDRSDMGRSGDAPSDESLPSSDEDHEEKVHEIYESVEELKKGGNVELHPEIYDDPDSEKELKKVGRKERKVENRGEKEQEKMRKLMDQIRDKDLSEEKKEKAVKKLIKYKESFTEKQTSERQVRQAREKEARSRLTDPLELVISQVLQNMMPDITRMVGEHGSQGRVERSGGRGQVRQAQNKVTHPRIICDGCSMRPITGVRYKCTVCPNFDYCEDCEENMGHPHPFIKINTPQQDYFSHGFFADHINRRHHHQLRVGSESEKFHHDAFEPFHGYGPMWAPRIMHTQRQEPVQREQRVQKEQREPREEREREQREVREQKEQLEREQRELRKQKEREQREQREREKREREQRDQREQREQREKREQKEQKVQETEKEKPSVQKATKVQKSQKKEREQKPRVDSWEKVQSDEREKENYASQTRKTDRSTDVEIEDETHLIRDAERYNVIKEGKELRERQNQNWVPSKDEDLKDLEKEKKTKVTQKEHLGDVKAKASKLKKEFPNTKFDTLIRYVEEAPEDLTTEELVNNFLSWK